MHLKMTIHQLPNMCAQKTKEGGQADTGRESRMRVPGGLGVQVLHNLHGQQLSGDFRIDSQGSEHRRNTTLKLHVNDSTNNLLHISDLTRSSRGSACATGGKRGNRPRSSPQCLHNGYGRCER